MAVVLDPDTIDDRSPDGWTREGDAIEATYEFDDYLAGVGFASGVAGLAQEAYHHPTIEIGFRSVTVRLTTHDAGGVTDADLDLAARIDSLDRD
ncbi:4a-hydroxytetrahydrobiopterin dehydratase [Halococcoides cellulosivorans]|uniref:4a-hydroxytetrahydrobiopterin dehydratase n=1 Tax=Halococcoides cellulosivorans TaxID=1679096 RepID=A0A2R4X0G7_9EURY|nr:4a-hydroxytetrahydrobiopterin dehydratase [Halococcoides cellulosivorans]AWB27294.1 4a-hydroxytetrahydrobiopterin dehydratase [Halococcoides cellulosivorans]